jgi:hypothetical protein
VRVQHDAAMLGSLEWDEYSGEAEILTPALSPVREPGK